MSSGVSHLRRASTSVLLGSLLAVMATPSWAGAAPRGTAAKAPSASSTTTSSTTAPRAASGVSLLPPSSAVPYGKAAPISVQVACTAGATGTVTLEIKNRTVGSATLTAGKASFSLAQLSGGAHVVTAHYDGSTRCAPGESRAMAFTVSAAASTLKLKADEPAPVRGQPLTLTASFTRVSATSAYPTGSVTFYDGAEALVSAPIDLSGTSAGTLEDLDAGVHELRAVYEGDSNYLEAEGELTVSVTPADVEVTASSLDRSNAQGEETVLDVVVHAVEPATGTPRGSVELRVAGAVLDQARLDDTGRARLQTTKLPVGRSELVAVFAGNDQYHGAAAEPVSITVRKSDVTPTSTTRVGPAPARGSNSRGLAVLAVLAVTALACGAVAGRQAVRMMAARKAASSDAPAGELVEGAGDAPAEGAETALPEEIAGEGTESLAPAPDAARLATDGAPETRATPPLAELLAELVEGPSTRAATEAPELRPVQVSDPLDAEILSYLNHGPSIEVVEALDPGELSLDQALAQLPAAAADPALAAMLRGAFSPLGADSPAPGHPGEAADGDVDPGS